MNGHRFTLVRDLALGEGDLLWIMLNPSTADDTIDDPTIRRVKGFTASEGFRRAVVVNLFSQRATKPTDLRSPSDDEYRANIAVVRAAIMGADKIVCGWGGSCPRQAVFTANVMIGAIHMMAGEAGQQLWCLGKTANGAPKHPLYLKADTPLMPF